MYNTQFLANYIEHFSYIGVFALVALSGYIIPIPEEISLLVTGYIAGLGFNNVYIASIAAILGILVGDNVLFFMSKYKGSRLIERLKGKVQQEKVMKYKRLMKQHIGKTIFILRFIVGLRFFSPMLAGSMNIRWKTFQLYNLIAAIAYTPLLIFLGYHFHNQLVLVTAEVEIVRHLIFAVVLILLGLFISIFVRKRFLIKNKV